MAVFTAAASSGPVVNGLPRGRNSVVECQLPKLDVEGSNPFARSNLCRQGPEAAKAPSGPSF